MDYTSDNFSFSDGLVLSNDMEMPITMELDTTAIGAASSIELEEKAAVNVVSIPYRGKCTYRGGKCNYQRTMKRNGATHSLCEMHRRKSCYNQRKVDGKRRERARCIAPYQHQSKEELCDPLLDYVDEIYESMVLEEYVENSLVMSDEENSVFVDEIMRSF